MSHNMRLENGPEIVKSSKIKNFSRFFEQAERRKGKATQSYARVENRHLELGKEGGLTLALAVVASKKAIDKRAVVRNRAKRRLRAAMRAVLQNRQPSASLQGEGQKEVAKLHLEWCLTAQRPALTLPWPELLAEVSSHWQHIAQKLEAATGRAGGAQICGNVPNGS